MRRFSFCLFNKLPAHEFRITISSLFTIARIVLTPVIVVAMLWGYWGGAFFLFIAASVTDLLDGFFARLLNQKTFLGACLDPLADKILLVSCYATLAFTNILPFAVPFWFVGLVLLRELLIVCGFVYVYCSKDGFDVAPTVLGKVTTALQMLFIMWLFACYFYGWVPAKTYYVVFYSIVVMVIVSLAQYVRIGLCHYRNGCS